MVPAQVVRRGGARPAPVRSAAHAHLSLEQLRELRARLADEQEKVSYWRRMLQARTEDVLSGGTGAGDDAQRLVAVLAPERVAAGRAWLLRLLPGSGLPPLPALAQLWDRRVDPADAQAATALALQLQVAQDALLTYRSALHERSAGATAELVARYREQPTLCLSALPPPRTGS
jgi:hypothetical protein